MEVGETFNVEHVNLVNKENSRHQLSHTVVNVFIDDLVYLSSQFIGDFRFLRLHELPHHGHDVLSALRSRIGDIQVVKSHVLNYFLPLVDIPLAQQLLEGYRGQSEICNLGQRNVLLSLQIEFRGKSVRSTLSLDSPTVGFDVDDISDLNSNDVSMRQSE